MVSELSPRISILLANDCRHFRKVSGFQITLHESKTGQLLINF